MTNTDTNGAKADTGDVKKRGKAVKSANPPRNEGTASGVSTLRGADHPHSDDAGRDGLPGVQPSNPVGDAPRVQEKPRTLAKATVTDTILENKISRLNAYRRLLRKPPNLPGCDAATKEIIQREYINWIKGCIAVALGGEESSASSGFDAQETVVLKEFAARMLNKAKDVVKTAEPPKTPTSIQSQLSVPNPEARPMRDRAPANNNARQYHDTTQRQIDELRRMDMHGPEF